MIVRRGDPSVPDAASPAGAEKNGAYSSLHVSEHGGLTQFGAYVETLQPGSRSSERHWHEREDEFLHLLSGEAVVIENDGEHVLRAGDSCCWPAGVANAHHVVNRSGAPCSFLIVGTKVNHDVCHYPDSARTLHTEGETWRVVDDRDGTVLRGGKVPWEVPADRALDEQALAALLDAYRDAVFARDLDALMALYAENAVVFDLWSAWRHDGRDAWRAAVETWFSSLGDERVEVAFDEVSSSAADELATLHALVSYRGLAADGTRLRAMQNRLGWTLRRHGGGWKIVHEHTSAPVDHASGKVSLQQDA